MTPSAYRFEFDESVELAEAEMTLHLAMIALEGLFGRAAVRLDARYRLDEAAGAIVVDASTSVGAALVRVFTTLLTREFGDEAFDVRQVLGGEPGAADAPTDPGARPPAGLTTGGRVA